MSNMSNLKFKKTHPSAQTPTRAHPHDAGLDLVAISAEYNNEYGYYEYDTGIAVELPPGHMGLLTARSSVSKTGLSMCNGIGTIDSSYRGSIKVRFYKETLAGIRSTPYVVGDKVAQLIVVPIRLPLMVECTELSESDRGQNGFGSSGT
jgi:dUTP pyrophosphatase